MRSIFRVGGGGGGGPPPAKTRLRAPAAFSTPPQGGGKKDAPLPPEFEKRFTPPFEGDLHESHSLRLPGLRGTSARGLPSRHHRPSHRLARGFQARSGADRIVERPWRQQGRQGRLFRLPAER